MKKYKPIISDAVFSVIVLTAAFLLNMVLDALYKTQTLIPMIFVLGVFLVSLKTQGFFWGITASVVSVFLVNYAFTYPYFGVDLVSPECIVSAVVMLLVAVMTGVLTTRIKKTEKMKAEIEKEMMRANLLRAVSHDLRTPLTTVYGSCSAIIENYDSLSKEQHIRLLGEIRADSQWLIRMVENLLTVTKIDGNNVHVKKTATVLEELVDAVLVKLKKRCPGYMVIVDIPEDFISIPMDAMLIEQVLINLLENAVYHAKGMTELILRVTINNNEARFEVVDNGCGIEESRLEDIFNGHLDRQNMTVDGGRGNMGIGLSVCSAIIKAHGGEIEVKNRRCGGVEFSFVLKMEEGVDE